MATLKELSEISGVQTPRTIGEQVYADQQINNQYSDVAPGDFGYTGNTQKNSQFYDPFHSNFQRLTQPLSNTFNKYAPQIAGGIMSLASGIPGLGMLMGAFKPDPYAQNRLDMYGGYGQFGQQDKFGYNVGSTLMQNNFMQPGSNSFRSYALEGLGGLNQQLANDFYQDNYGLTFDQVKSDIQNKQNPFGPQPTNIGTSDYYGGDNNNNSGGRNETGFGGGFGRDPDDKA
jgi:hypothetical protein